jgi:hypothetical protein
MILIILNFIKTFKLSNFWFISKKSEMVSKIDHLTVAGWQTFSRSTQLGLRLRRLTRLGGGSRLPPLSAGFRFCRCIEFSVDSFKNVDIDFEFRDWTYVKIMISLSIKSNEAQVCLDTECSVILADREFIKIHESHYIIRRMIISLNVRELEINKHEISKYIIASIYFREHFSKNEKFVREVIRRKIHLVNNLKVNMLIDNDILRSKNIFIDDVNSKVIVSSCQNMIISIEIRTLTKKMINKILHARFITMISSYSMIIISIHRSNLSFSRDFRFESADLNIFMYAHIVNDFISDVMIKNESNKSIKISRNARLETFIEILYSNAFHVDLIDENYVCV